MTTSIENPKKIHGKVMGGIIILVLGSILLLDQLNLFFVPSWLFSWPMWMIAYGVYVGAKHDFRKPVWIWLVIIGTAFLFTQNFDDAGRFIWPVAIMGIGSWMVLKYNKPKSTPDQQHTNYTEV